MVHCCFVDGCRNNSKKNKTISFHLFPKIVTNQCGRTKELAEGRRKCWIAAKNRIKEPTKHSFICSEHFVHGKPSALFDSTSPDWVPSLKLCKDDFFCFQVKPTDF